VSSKSKKKPQERGMKELMGGHNEGAGAGKKKKHNKANSKGERDKAHDLT